MLEVCHKLKGQDYVIVVVLHISASVFILFYV